MIINNTLCCCFFAADEKEISHLGWLPCRSGTRIVLESSLEVMLHFILARLKLHIPIARRKYGSIEPSSMGGFSQPSARLFLRSRYAVIPIPIMNSQDRSLVRSPGPSLKCLAQFPLYLNIDCLVNEPLRMIWRRVVFMTCFTQTRASTKFHSFNSEDVICTGNCTMWNIAWHLMNISTQYSGKLSDFDPFTK